MHETNEQRNRRLWNSMRSYMVNGDFHFDNGRSLTNVVLETIDSSYKKDLVKFKKYKFKF